MKKLFTIVLSSIMLLGVAGCKQSKAEQELARLQDSLNNAKVEQQKLYDDSIKKVQEEQRQQAIDDSIAKAKQMEAAQADNYIREELRKYLLDKNSRVVVSTSAQNDLDESTWPEAQCPASIEGICPYEDDNCGPLFGVSEGYNAMVTKVGTNRYKYSVVCPCGCNKRFTDFTTMVATLSTNGNVILEHVFWD